MNIFNTEKKFLIYKKRKYKKIINIKINQYRTMTTFYHKQSFKSFNVK